MTGKIGLVTVLAMGLAIDFAKAQVRIYDPKQTVERSVESRTNSKVDQGINKGLDKIEEGVMGIFKKKDKSKPASTDQPTTNTGTSSADGATTTTGNSPRRDETPVPTGDPKVSVAMKAYQKFDFVPGERVMADEDFMQDAVGDFPDKWNSTGSGEIVTIDGKPGHWLMLNKKGEYLPEFIKTLPENFTLQFDLATNEKFNFYSSYFWVNMVQMTNPAKDFMKWGRFPAPTEGVRVGLHPQGAGNEGIGMTELITYAKGTELLKNESDQRFFVTPNQTMVRVSMWRQKQRLRVYINEAKIWDIPRAFQPDITYNGVVLSMDNMSKEEDRFYISNLRLAVGAPDTRNKLITEGKFVTHGILFDINSDQIKPESYGALKDIAGVLTENTTVRVSIVGHTDSDGDDASNMALSKKRAAAVKAALTGSFGIAADRMETDGQGESKPAGPNTTAEGKANNRRVEFVRL